MSKTRISRHISYKEATKSITAKRNGIDNTPPSELIPNGRLIAKTIFELVREAMGNIPIGLSSFFRCEKLNVRIGGSKNSQHCYFQAMDIDADMYGGVTNAEIFKWIKNNSQFDQLIWEHGDNKEPDWVHVSKTAGENRNEILVSYKDQNNDTQYRYYENNI